MTLALPISIVSDIGGTNTRVALARDGQMIEASIRRYRNIGYAGLEPILIEYLEAEGVAHCDGACIAVAGPVRDGEAEMTNLDWSMTDASIRTATGAPTVALLNDLQAQGHALGHLNEASLRHIVAEPGAGPKAAKLVIGVGTGFNAAPVHETPHGRLVAASECGHVNLPVRTAADLRLMSYIEQLEDAHGLASVEDVLSGRGLERVYTWAASEARQSQERTAAEIMAAIAAGNDAVAVVAAGTFARMLGMVAGNLALIHLPFGGLYLCGGVARAFAPYFQRFGFVEAFRDKARFAQFMHGFPISVIEDDYAALRGAARHLAHRLAH